MNLIEKVISFFKNKFSKKVKMLDEPTELEVNNKKINFKDSLKVKGVKKKKGRIETLICPGDGLGIQNKISY